MTDEKIEAENIVDTLFDQRDQQDLAKRVKKLNFKSSIVFLLNGERVLSEISGLAKMHISELLKVRVEDVICSLELNSDGKVIPTFSVNSSQIGAWEKQYIQKSIAEVWLGWAKSELVERLQGLSEVRKGVI